ncbi:MAG: hypothetical protein A2825_01490 [Candidatus Taylorbacteria bacterium RIFCSPHIGHO2_01_FULL_43_120]|nr:MAG: hypothetical protein A2825_01490 [Candidatus Taylorbacteria bacterium RIFCSPHIGHO2_01_FULL_43_120]OHA28031.1 MAG: hypothetical protein A3E92_04855 [Candidatus Taylorbacteria bacterium RIFCSPHIGHO2_12_FULL_42_34]OHA32264.1 MAG: hypothetical protein A3B09_02070 [Candidatus Taylorbacteria bacterium RIFCSPLOWO2_01_FULL_43_83]OHA37857.1 MAG: hypothetical protein A3H58_02100 [Candidatus Taylorbacteria bacterium RIFCSPLOWO2_02_FULL_43_22b]
MKNGFKITLPTMEEKTIKIMKEAARAGGGMVKKYFGGILEVIPKTTAADFKTKADMESEREIVTLLSGAFPEYNILSEESDYRDNGSGYTFIIDPLDGTNNFFLGVPYVSVAVALMKDEETLVSVIHDPFHDLTYHAVKNGGSFLNGSKIVVNKLEDVDQCTISYACSYNTAHNKKREDYSHIVDLHPKRAMSLWSPSRDFALLASGKIEAVVFNNPELYDYIPGKLLAAEAGALITKWDGEKDQCKNSEFIASNGTGIHAKIIQALNK